MFTCQKTGGNGGTLARFCPTGAICGYILPCRESLESVFLVSLLFSLFKYRQWGRTLGKSISFAKRANKI